MALLRNMQFFIENYNDCKSPTKAFNYSQQFFLAIQSVNKKWLHDIYLLFLFLCIIGRHFFYVSYFLPFHFRSFSWLLHLRSPFFSRDGPPVPDFAFHHSSLLEVRLKKKRRRGDLNPRPLAS